MEEVGQMMRTTSTLDHQIIIPSAELVTAYLAAVVLHESGVDEDVVATACVVSRSLEHEAGRLDAFRPPRKRHIVDVRLHRTTLLLTL